MKKFLLFVPIIIFYLSACQVKEAKSQVVIPVKWTYTVTKVSDDEVSLNAIAKIDKTWHLYSQFFPEGGPIRMVFTFEDSPNYKRIGKVSEFPKPHVEYDDIFEIEIKYFEDKATFSQKIKILSDKDFVVKGSLAGQTCTTVDGKCVQVNDDFEFKVKGVKVEQTVENNSVADSSDLQVDTVKTQNADSSVVPETEKVEPDKKEQSKIDTNIVETNSLWGLFFMSFIFGLLAIVTPCVFPMIPMTVTFFLHDEKGKNAGRRKALFFGSSIIGIYTIIGTLVAIILGPAFANFLSTHWIPNVLFFLIFIFFAASFLGMFEIVLPSWLITKSDEKADKGGLLAPFFMAFTLVVVSFSCTGPLVGSILVQSAGGAFLKPVIGMFGFSLAFAIPFTLFAFFPGMLQNLPKSGGWLNSVKVVLGFLELALGLKFLSIADQTYHWGILDREIYLAIWIVIFSLMGLYLIGKLKFSHDSELKFIKVPRLMIAIATFTFVVYLIPGMFGAPLKALSGYLPPQSSLDFDISRMIRENPGTSASDTGKELCETPKYNDKLHLPHGLKGYFDYEQGLACAKEQNKPVFIDFTGHGCVNCREMESRVWVNPEVLKILKEEYIIIALYVDDRTDLKEEEYITSTYDGKVKKTIGSKNGDFQITRFDINAQPYYVLLDTNAELLVKPTAYDLNPEHFIEFLKNGVEEFKKRTK